ncbi:MAG: hypothetical protein MJY95_01650 [Bacteroidaceae bacterium]|nr:hypothetical protein [Bacteroidaceae bacterium]
MGLLFVILFYIVCIGIIFLILGIINLIIAIILRKKKQLKTRLLAWFLVPGIIIGGFGAMFFIENILYSIITNSDIGVGDYASVNINDKYNLYWIDIPNWEIGPKESCDGKTFHNIQEILTINDTIAFTSQINGSSPDSTYCILTQLISDNALAIDSAKSTKVLWDKYALKHKYDRNKICTCDEYYWNKRKYFFWGSIILNILLIVFAIKKYGRKLLFKNSES